MRMRKKKHRDERLSLCSEFIYEPTGVTLTDPAKELFSEEGAPVFLEIGAGKGGFAVGMVKKHPEACYIALERVTDCVMLAAERAKREASGAKLLFVNESADNLTSLLAPGTVSAIFLNFSDPWSKKGYSKRRLTHRRYLAVYMSLLTLGGTLTFKTDNDGLFDFTLDELAASGIIPDAVTRDLHASEYNEGNVVTEYEANFSAQGQKINMLKFTKREESTLEIPEELSKNRKSYLTLGDK